ncbi:ABC-2 family transporter protein [Chryseobacterium piscicola]|nr:ABC-2 family transporter protein [Chryseobacterium piscicola]
MPFKVFSIMYFAILVGLLFIGLVDLNLWDGMKLNLKEQGMYDFPAIWHFTTYFVAFLKIFLGLIIVFSICQEFSNRMFKQNTIDGLSRKEFIASKLLTTFIFTLISTIIIFLITFWLGKTYSKVTDSELIFKEMFFIGHYFLKLFTFFTFLLFLSVLFRKSIFVLLFLFFYWVAESIITPLEKYIHIKDLNIKEKLEAAQNDFYISNLFPLESMSNLIPSPFIRMRIAEGMGYKYQFHYPTESVITCIVWCIIFTAGSYLILKKRDW